MAEPTNKQAEQPQTTEMPTTQAPIPDEKADRDQLMEDSQQFLRTLFRTGIRLAMTPVSLLPQEPRHHFFSAGRELTLGLATLAHEVSNVFDQMVDEVKKDVEDALQDKSVS